MTTASQYREYVLSMGRPHLDALYREFRTDVFSRLHYGPRSMSYDNMTKWLALGLVCEMDGDRTRRLYDLSTRGANVRGIGQFVQAIREYDNEQMVLRMLVGGAE